MWKQLERELILVGKHPYDEGFAGENTADDDVVADGLQEGLRSGRLVSLLKELEMERNLTLKMQREAKETYENQLLEAFPRALKCLEQLDTSHRDSMVVLARVETEVARVAPIICQVSPFNNTLLLLTENRLSRCYKNLDN